MQWTDCSRSPAIQTRYWQGSYPPHSSAAEREVSFNLLCVYITAVNIRSKPRVIRSKYTLHIPSCKTGRLYCSTSRYQWAMMHSWVVSDRPLRKGAGLEIPKAAPVATRARIYVAYSSRMFDACSPLLRPET